eukprot:2704469-Amphidinium_carterae.1
MAQKCPPLETQWRVIRELYRPCRGQRDFAFLSLHNPAGCSTRLQVAASIIIEGNDIETISDVNDQISMRKNHYYEIHI